MLKVECRLELAKEQDGHLMDIQSRTWRCTLNEARIHSYLLQLGLCLLTKVSLYIAMPDGNLT